MALLKLMCSIVLSFWNDSSKIMIIKKSRGSECSAENPTHHSVSEDPFLQIGIIKLIRNIFIFHIQSQAIDLNQESSQVTCSSPFSFHSEVETDACRSKPQMCHYCMKCMSRYDDIPVDCFSNFPRNWTCLPKIKGGENEARGCLNWGGKQKKKMVGVRMSEKVATWA